MTPKRVAESPIRIGWVRKRTSLSLYESYEPKTLRTRHRLSMDPQKVFRASIVGRWTRKKFSKPLSSDDGPAKSFPCLYRRTMDPQKVFHASIVERWTLKKFSEPLSIIDGPEKSSGSRHRLSMDPKSGSGTETHSAGRGIGTFQ